MLNRFIKSVKNTKILRHTTQIRMCAIQKHSEENDSSIKQYTLAERKRILELLNTLKLEECESYNVTKGRANKLIAWKNRSGQFQNLNDIFLVDGFGHKVAEKFYQSLLDGPSVANKAKKSSQSRTATYVTPTLDTEQRDLIRSCVSMRIGVSSVTWARLELPAAELNSPCLLTHWHHHEISSKKLHLQDLVQRCLYVDHQIPAADCYLFENPQMAQINANPGSAEQQNINIQKSQISAILSFAMNRRCFNDNDNITNDNSTENHNSKVFYLRRFLAARLFNHLIGTERVSSEQTILKMMRTHFNANDAPDLILENSIENESNHQSDEKVNNNENATNLTLRGEVLFTNDLRKMFAHAQRYHREFLGQALLLNLAFVRLILLQDPKSLALITKQKKKK